VELADRLVQQGLQDLADQQGHLVHQVHQALVVALVHLAHQDLQVDLVIDI
jgi:hypothetical protein